MNVTIIINDNLFVCFFFCNKNINQCSRVCVCLCLLFTKKKNIDCLYLMTKMIIMSMCVCVCVYHKLKSKQSFFFEKNSCLNDHVRHYYDRWTYDIYNGHIWQFVCVCVYVFVYVLVNKLLFYRFFLYFRIHS